ncbi:MAG: HAD family hydrolase [Dehalococcoidia bacterium]
MIVVFFDVDNTLFDMQRFRQTFDSALVESAGASAAARLWEQYEAVRSEFGHVDLPEAVRRLTTERPAAGAAVTQVIERFDYPSLVAPGAPAAIAAARRIGRPVIVSDGDPHFQREKIRRSGLEAAVNGDVRVYRHKEAHLAELLADFSADRYWMVDDKARLLGIFKRTLGDRITTVQIAYGKYSSAGPDAGDPAPDRTIGRIGDLAALLETVSSPRSR